ncbi:6,7-dimethyl-8-ribityllumazine synthase [Flavobacteriales bacterium]|jgi:6,7-dimethyl-8-ribityllumazine synthase|nr:6,7-dimethyl-8-ribityllumazine synthase [Flavobacteriales bacterium]MDB9931741.1 6,7-dimethyl-8-ribityllumazine synthase [Flavobacteriales bacterium]MDC1370377.1 6,7-dimethyl-8-ribityllumazine synthase [Flavobacteriales bacterium]MDG1176143.1 6,7-dimethyl-8-ribityllumazine synthase [Flavobacteriales bacterium]
MATANTNLSEYDKELIPNASSMSFGIVVSEWNANITDNLLQGAYDTLIENGAKEENIIVKRVPGTYELSLASQLMFENTSVDSVVAIGSVIQGETKHFDFVCEAVSQGIKDVNLKYNKPAIFCVLTDNTLQQAIDRSGGLHGNKGVECAVAAIKMVALKNELKG